MDACTLVTPRPLQRQRRSEKILRRLESPKKLQGPRSGGTLGHGGAIQQKTEGLEGPTKRHHLGRNFQEKNGWGKGGGKGELGFFPKIQQKQIRNVTGKTAETIIDGRTRPTPQGY